MRWLVLLGMVACGGSVDVSVKDAAPPEASAVDAAVDAAVDVSHDVADATADAPRCVCTSVRLMCDGQPTDDALSCATCGYPCNSTPDAAAD